MALLPLDTITNFDYEGRELFADTSEKIKQETRSDNGLHSFSTVMKNSSLGFSVISMNANGDLEELFRQVFSFAALKKYVTKCKIVQIGDRTNCYDFD